MWRLRDERPEVFYLPGDQGEALRGLLWPWLRELPWGGAGMKASEMIALLTDLVAAHGDRDVLVDCGTVGYEGLRAVDECDLDVDDNGFVVWLESGE